MTWEARHSLAGVWVVGRIHPQLGGFEPLAEMRQPNAFNNQADARYIAAALNDYDPDGEMYDREHSRVPAGLS